MICGVVALWCGLIGMLFLRPQHEAARFASAELRSQPRLGFPNDQSERANALETLCP
jgi:hypothetical protein